MIIVGRLFNKYLKGNTLIKSFSVYTLARVINSCIPFLLLPVMTSYLSPADYGMISMITTIASFMLPFTTVRVEDAIIRRYYYKGENIGLYMGNCFLIVATMWSFLTLLMFIFSSVLSHYAQVPHQVFWVLPLYCVLNFFKALILYYWQVNKQPIKYGIYNITATITEISIAILLVVVFKFNWIGRAISLFSTAFICAVFSFIYLNRKVHFQFRYDKERLRHALFYGAGLVPGGIGLSLATLTNRFFLTSMIGIDETGLYGVASSFAGILAFITGSFNAAWVPFLFEKLSKGDESDKYKIVKMTYLYFLIMALIVVVMYLFISFLLPIFVNERFAGASKYVIWLLLGYAFTGCYFMVTNYIMYVEKTRYTSYIALFTGIVSIGLNYILIKYFGAIGAAMALALTHFIFFICTWIVSAKIYPMPWFRLKRT